MSLSTDDRNRVEAFRDYIEDTVATDDRYGEPAREDSAGAMASRFHEGRSCWFEVAVLADKKQVRVGFFTTDAEVNNDCEQVIAESGETPARFVELAFEEAGLEWDAPSVEHGKQADASFYATPLAYEDSVDLDSDEIRDKTIRMLEGYLIAFGPAIGPEEE